MDHLIFAIFLIFASKSDSLGETKNACTILKLQTGFYNFTNVLKDDDMLQVTYKNLKVVMSKFKALPRLYCAHTLGLLSDLLNKPETMEILYYLAIFLGELSKTLLSSSCTNIEQITSILKRNLTRTAFSLSYSKSFSMKVQKCLYADEYFAESLLEEDETSIFPMSACLNYQLIRRRMENYSKAIAWHLHHRKPRFCYRGLLQLQSRCLKSAEEHTAPRNCTQWRDNCHNLVDFCLGPVDFYKGGSIFLDEKLNNITHSLGSLYHPDLLLSVINASTEAITIENIRAIAEECEMLLNPSSPPDNIIEQKVENMRKYLSNLNQGSSNVTFLKKELDDALKTMEWHQEKTLEYMKKIDEMTELIDSQICKPCNEHTSNAAADIGTLDTYVNEGDRALNDDPEYFRGSSGNKIDALQDTSLAYRAGQYNDKKLFDALLLGSGSEPDLPEGPLLAVELKYASSPVAASTPQQSFVTKSVETKKDYRVTQLDSNQTDSSPLLGGLPILLLMILSLSFTI